MANIAINAAKPDHGIGASGMRPPLHEDLAHLEAADSP
jgi:hypothetical protein